MGEPERPRELAELVELRRRDPAGDRQVSGRRSEVLTQREDVDPDGAQIGDRGPDLGGLLAHARG